MWFKNILQNTNIDSSVVWWVCVPVCVCCVLCDKDCVCFIHTNVGVYEGEAEALSAGGVGRQGSGQDHQDPALGQSQDAQMSLPSSEKKRH